MTGGIVPAISTCLWFDGQALDAAEFYTAIFPNSRIDTVVRRPPSSPGGPDVLTVLFCLDGRPFLGLNGGPHFTFNESVSLIVACETQDEIDHYWSRLTDGGKESRCGWLKDRFGLSWQINYAGLPELMTGNPQRAGRVMAAMMQMKKIDIAALQAAAAG